MVNQNGSRAERPGLEARARQAADRWGSVHRFALLGLLAVAFFSHAFNLFNYPLYLGDEGIYLEQAWAVLRQGRLSPYTYWYDHAPAGWLMIAAWIFVLPKQFATFGMAVNSGRVLMLLTHVVSVYLLYESSNRLAGNRWAGLIAGLVFSLSPLALFYQRMLLLDNLMAFWVLMSLYLIVANRDRLITLMASGLAFGMALLSKENAMFFAPVFAYLLYTTVRPKPYFRFGIAGWAFCALSVVSAYPMYAWLKDELLPSGGFLGGAPAERVSLLSTLLWQMTRSQGSIMDPNSLFWAFSIGRWWPKDAALLVAGGLSTAVNLAIGLSNRSRRRGYLVASLLSLAYIVYLARGSVMLDFYVLPLLPFLAMNVGVLLGNALHALPWRALGFTLLVVILGSVSHLYIQDSQDHYTLNLVQVQAQQLQYIRQNIPASAVMIVDDDLWVDLHEPMGRTPVYPKAHSHWKVAGDPEIRDKLLGNDWRRVDYVIVSNKMLEVVQRENETLVLDAFKNSRPIARFEKGDVLVEVRKVIK